MAIEVLKKRDGKVYKARCNHCDSELGYKEEDRFYDEKPCGLDVQETVKGFLWERIEKQTVMTVQRRMCIICPVCKHKISVEPIDFFPVVAGTYEMLHRYR